MKWKALAAGATLLSTVLLSYAQTSAIDEKKFVVIEGMEQWITIKGNDRSNPAILFLHGGPGSPLSPYAKAIFKEWEREFVLVNWDQRGAGRSFGRNAPEELDEAYILAHPLNLGQMTNDGIALTEYLLRYLEKEKIILFGTSWGTALGASMASVRPDLYHAYLGHAQLVDPATDIIQVYHKTQQIALKQKDSTSVEMLRSLGPPPYQQARHLGQLLRIVKQYERANATPAPAVWWKLHPEYDNVQDESDRIQGDDYSFIYYAGHQPMGIQGMINSVDFMRDRWRFELPVYLIQGEKDLLTPLEITRSYFEKIDAPEKDLTVVPEAAHGFNQAIVDVAYNILVTKIQPSIRRKMD